MSERLGPVPADLQAWAKRASVVTTVNRKREATRWDLSLLQAAETKLRRFFSQEKVAKQIADFQKEKCESWEGDKGDKEEREEESVSDHDKDKEESVADHEEGKEESVCNKDKEVKKATHGLRLK